MQRTPELPSYLQGVIDADPKPGRWIPTGSQNLALLESVSQSLAGRSAVLNLLPLARSEILRFEKHPRSLDERLLDGGYPRILDQRLDPSDWLRAYVGTYLERNVRAISNIGDLTTFQRFLVLCAGRSRQLLNYSALAADCGVSQPTAKSWIRVLEASFIAFRHPAFHTNLRKRLVKMPKLHFYDTGLVCWLLGTRTPKQLRSHPLRGSIFESRVVSEIFKHRTNAGETTGLSFYRDRDALESDLIVEHANRLTIVEAKAGQTASASLFDGVRRVRDLLAGAKRTCEAIVVYGGDEAQSRSDASLIPWRALHERSWA